MKTPPNGFTLLETIIAISVLLFGILSIIALSTYSTQTAQFTEREFQAANFAREGLEIVRSIRDSNWLAYEADNTTEWNSGFTHPVLDPPAVVATDLDDPGATYELEFRPDDFDDTCPSQGGGSYACTAMWHDSTSDQYLQTTSLLFDASAYTQTAFSRLVYLYPLCRNADDFSDERIASIGQTCAAIGTSYVLVGYKVVSTVRWGDGTESHFFSVEEHLYDWKYAQ